MKYLSKKELIDLSWEELKMYEEELLIDKQNIITTMQIQIANWLLAAEYYFDELTYRESFVILDKNNITYH